MRYFLPAAGLALALFPAVAFAADAVIEEPVAQVYDWNGLYVGISGGYLKPELDVGFLGSNVGYGDDNYLIGGTAGYNFQKDNFVFGIEGDLSYAKIEGTVDGANDPFGFGFETNADGNYFATVRGRVGYAFDRVLIYGTGGIAFAGLDVETPAGTISDDKTGYTVGGGLEFGITEHLTTKVEYLYSDFGSDTTTLFPGDVDTDFQMHTVRVGLNYKF